MLPSDCLSLLYTDHLPSSLQDLILILKIIQIACNFVLLNDVAFPSAPEKGLLHFGRLGLELRLWLVDSPLADWCEKVKVESGKTICGAVWKCLVHGAMNK